MNAQEFYYSGDGDVRGLFSLMEAYAKHKIQERKEFEVWLLEEYGDNFSEIDEMFEEWKSVTKSG